MQNAKLKLVHAKVYLNFQKEKRKNRPPKSAGFP